MYLQLCVPSLMNSAYSSLHIYLNIISEYAPFKFLHVSHKQQYHPVTDQTVY
jgi:hypothetical protein